MSPTANNSHFKELTTIKKVFSHLQTASGELDVRGSSEFHDQAHSNINQQEDVHN